MGHEGAVTFIGNPVPERLIEKAMLESWKPARVAIMPPKPWPIMP